MTERKFTDEEVIKALECCSQPYCNNNNCPLNEHTINTKDCITKLSTNALDLIKRQRVEILALTSAVDNSTQEFLKLHDEYQGQKAEIEILREQAASESKGNVKFKTGDYAKIANNFSGHNFEIGTIVKLEKYSDDYKAFANGDYWWVTDDDLMKIDDLAKEMTEGKQ